MKVKFLETAIYCGNRYEVDSEANISAEVAKVLGGSVKVLEKDKRDDLDQESKPEKKQINTEQTEVK